VIAFDTAYDTLPKCLLRNGTTMAASIAMRRKTLGIRRRPGPLQSNHALMFLVAPDSVAPKNARSE